MKILITGGAGYIGSHVAVELIDAGHTPIIVDDFSNSTESVLDRIADITGSRPLLYQGNVCNHDFLRKVCDAEHDIAGIIHFAAYKSISESLEKPLAYYRNNLVSLLTVLDIAQEYAIHHIVFSSSATVYGDPESSPIKETAPRKPATNPYGNTKSIAEDVLRDTVASGVPIKAISLRYFNPIGAHPSGLIGELPLGPPANLVPYLTQTAAGVRDTLSIFGDDYDTPDGTGVRDFIHVVDLAKAHIATLTFLIEQSETSLYDVYNVGTGHGTSVQELIDIFEKINSVPVPHKTIARRPGDVASCWSDPRKINTTMHWYAKKTIEDSLKDAWRWQKSLAKK